MKLNQVKYCLYPTLNLVLRTSRSGIIIDDGLADQDHFSSDRRIPTELKPRGGLRASEVKQRAAWAWARSAQLYEQCAANLERDGPDTQALNLKSTVDNRRVLQQVAQTLRKRARLAKSHAGKLISETTADNIRRWTLSGDGLSR